MQLGWFAGLAAVVAATLVLGCSPSTEAPPPPVDIDTLRAALTERDELERTYLLTRYLRTLSPDDLPGALAELERQRVGITADEVRLFMLAWTRFDGPGAFETARNWPTSWSTILTEQAMQAWGFNDGRGALAEWERIEDEDLQTTLRAALVAGWVGSYDREGVTEFAATVEEPRRRNRLAFRLTGQTMRDGPDAVMAWADAIPIDAPNEFKHTIFSHAVAAVARVDPGRAAPWYERHINQPYSSMTLRNIAIKWAEHHDPNALIEWIETLPFDDVNEPERVDAIRAAVRVWASNASAEAENWLESTQPGPARDAAIGEFLRETFDASPRHALSWVTRIEDESLRKKNALRFTRQWIEREPEIARSWLADSEFPPDWKTQILINASRHRGSLAVPDTDPDA